MITDEDSLEKGYSGSPILDQRSGHVLGVVIARRSEKSGTAISIAALRNVWPSMPPTVMTSSVHDSTIADLSRRIALDPTNLNNYLERGHALFLRGDYDQAIVDLTHSIDRDPDNSQADFYWRGVAYYENGEYALAIKDLTSAIRLAVIDDCDEYYWRGQAYFCNKDYDLAIKDLLRTSSIKPNNPVDHFCLSRAYFEKGDIVSALREINIALQLDPENKEYIRWRTIYARRQLDITGHGRH